MNQPLAHSSFCLYLLLLLRCIVRSDLFCKIALVAMAISFNMILGLSHLGLDTTAEEKAGET